MGKFISLLILFGGFLLPATVFAQEVEEEFQVTAIVYEDSNYSGVFEIADELQLDGWTLELYDDTFVLLDSEISSDSDTTTLGSNASPSYICVVPQANWLQTAPTVGENYPGDVAWFCYDVSQQDTDVFEFGVYQEEAEPEDIPSILGESNSIPDVKDEPETAEVLGATTEVLAETGVPALIVPVVGFGFIVSVITLARRSELN